MLTYEIESADRIVVIRGSVPEAPERLRFLEIVAADPAYRPGFGFLRDRRGLPALTNEDIELHLTFLTGIPALRHGRWAMVVDDPDNLGSQRWAAVLAKLNDIRVAVFANEDDARRWLVDYEAEPVE